MLIDQSFAGCRYVTVDAYSQSLQFYENCGFEYLTPKDEGKQTRLMYFDLAALIE
jgi:hypothetical protein